MEILAILGGFAVAFFIYFVPTYVARERRVENGGPVFIINFFLGWTFVGWVVALAMAAGAKQREQAPPPPSRRPAPSNPETWRFKLPCDRFGGSTLRQGLGALGMAIAFVVTTCAANPISPPTPSDIVAKPAASKMKDAHVVVTGSGGGATFTGDGLMVFKPKFAMDLHLSTSVGVIPIVIETISVDGNSYTKLGADKFTIASANDTSNPTAQSTDLKQVAEETIGNDKAWHISGKRSGQPFDEWVRESDGYLLKMIFQNDQGAQFTFVLDRFDTSAKVVAPPASQIKPAAKNVTGSIGQLMALNGMNVTVVTADSNAKADNSYQTPAAGKRFVVARVLYENVGSDPLDTGTWTLADAQAFNYQTSYGVKEPTISYQKINPGEKLRGYVAFEVPASVTALQLKLKLGDDAATVAIP